MILLLRILFYFSANSAHEVKTNVIEIDETIIENPEWFITFAIVDLYKNHKGTEGQGTDIEFKFQRKSLRYLTNVYFPSILLCFTSALSLHIPIEITAARMSLSITTFLAMVTHFRGAE